MTVMIEEHYKSGPNTTALQPGPKAKPLAAPVTDITLQPGPKAKPLAAPVTDITYVAAWSEG